MPTDLDDRITRALDRLAASVDVAEPTEAPRIEWTVAPVPVRHGALVGWLAVAAAIVLLLVIVAVWRGGAGTGVSDVPTAPSSTRNDQDGTVTVPAESPATTLAVDTGSSSVPAVPTATLPVPYGEIPPLEDVSIFYLPDPMPNGWHVTQVLHSVDHPLDWAEEGGPLDADQRVPAGTFREFSVSMVRDDGEVFVMYTVVETPRERVFAVHGSSEEIEVAGRRVAALAAPGDRFLGPSWLDAGTEYWSWEQDGRAVEVSIAGDASSVEPVVAAMEHVSARRVLGPARVGGDHPPVVGVSRV